MRKSTGSLQLKYEVTRIDYAGHFIIYRLSNKIIMAGKITFQNCHLRLT